MNKYRVLVFDLDGTLFMKDQMISQNAINKIIELQEKGYIVGIATGRFLCELDSFMKQLKLEKYKGFVITANGTEIYDFEDHKRHVFNKLSKQETYELINIAKRYQLITYVHEDKDYHVFSSRLLKTVQSSLTPIFKIIGTPFFKSAAKLKLETQINLNKEEYDKLCFAGAKKNLDKFVDQIDSTNDGYAVYPSSNFSREIVCRGVSKYSACNYLMHKKNLTLKTVVFFGDSGNDEELLKHAGLGIAMKNALPSTIKAAHSVSEFTNRQDGVYKELVKLFD